MQRKQQIMKEVFLMMDMNVPVLCCSCTHDLLAAVSVLPDFSSPYNTRRLGLKQSFCTSPKHSTFHLLQKLRKFSRSLYNFFCYHPGDSHNTQEEPLEVSCKI
jgi:hypothetical protein